MKPTTEKEIWLLIAEAFEHFAKTGEENHLGIQTMNGLCWALKMSTDWGRIRESGSYKIQSELENKHGPTWHDSQYTRYLFSYGQKYAMERASLAKKFASQCE